MVEEQQRPTTGPEPSIAGGAELPPTRPAKQLSKLPTLADKNGIEMLFLYITVAKCQKAAKPLQPLIEFAFLRVN